MYAGRELHLRPRHYQFAEIKIGSTTLRSCSSSLAQRSSHIEEVDTDDNGKINMNKFVLRSGVISHFLQCRVIDERSEEINYTFA